MPCKSQFEADTSAAAASLCMNLAREEDTYGLEEVADGRDIWNPAENGSRILVLVADETS